MVFGIFNKDNPKKVARKFAETHDSRYVAKYFEKMLKGMGDEIIEYVTANEEQLKSMKPGVDVGVIYVGEQSKDISRIIDEIRYFDAEGKSSRDILDFFEGVKMKYIDEILSFLSSYANAYKGSVFQFELNKFNAFKEKYDEFKDELGVHMMNGNKEAYAEANS